MTVTIVPGQPSGPTHLVQGEPGTLEATLDTAPQRSGISGRSISHRKCGSRSNPSGDRCWRTGVYDRFTGDEVDSDRPEQPVRRADRIAAGRLQPGRTDHHRRDETKRSCPSPTPVAPLARRRRDAAGERLHHGQPRPENAARGGRHLQGRERDRRPQSVRAPGRRDELSRRRHRPLPADARRNLERVPGALRRDHGRRRQSIRDRGRDRAPPRVLEGVLAGGLQAPETPPRSS